MSWHMAQATYHMQALQQMKPRQGNGATMIHEMGSSFHYLNRGTWATHVQLLSLASRLESSHLFYVLSLTSPRPQGLQVAFGTQTI
jgi:hypothetical protein